MLSWGDYFPSLMHKSAINVAISIGMLSFSSISIFTEFKEK